MTRKIQLCTSVIALLALLAYTFVHTGALLSAYIAPWWVGYIAAFGVETSVVSLSLRIGELKRARQNALFFSCVLCAVVFVSALANVAAGYEHSEQVRLTLRGLAALDPAQAVIGFASTALISLIVFAISEIIGVDVREIARKAERDAARDTSSAVQDAPAPVAAAAYACASCEEVFAKSQQLAAHVRYKHGNGHRAKVEVMT